MSEQGRTRGQVLAAVRAEPGASGPEVAAARLLRQGRVHPTGGIGICALLLPALSIASCGHLVNLARAAAQEPLLK